MKWYDKPTEANNFWKQNFDAIKSGETEWFWSDKRIKYTIFFNDKSVPPKVWEYDFDGIKPEGYGD